MQELSFTNLGTKVTLRVRSTMHVSAKDMAAQMCNIACNV